jgi:hypothetical protein
VLLCFVAGALVRAEDVAHGPPAPTTSAETGARAGSTRVIEHDGQVFQLANATVAKNVETDEYVPEAEKITDWTQLITVQRLALAQSAGTDDFLAYFQKRVTQDGASVDVLKQAKLASVFAVRFPPSERNEEQVMICLAFVEPARPTLLNIVQYAIKPHRASVGVVEMRIRSWRDKFVRQAQALSQP